MSASGRRSHSPDGLGGSERKRRRKVLSCYDCRRRKLQCDRATPACSRCTKAGQAANCLYLEDSTDGPDRPTDALAKAAERDARGPFYGSISRPIRNASTNSDVASRLEYQERRIKQLEHALATSTGNGIYLTPPNTTNRTDGHPPFTPESALGDGRSCKISDRETLLLRGKSFKTQFYGATHPGALLAHLSGLQQFTRDCFTAFPAMASVRTDLHAIQKRSGNMTVPPTSVTDDQLRELLPTRSDADGLIQLYFDSYESVFHLFHMPRFWDEYNSLWDRKTQARPHFVATLLLMSASVQCLTFEQPWLYRAESSAARQNAVTLIQTCEIWLERQSQKKVTASDFQLRCLLLLAKDINIQKKKRAWTQSGELVRFCMAAGLHRDPELIMKQTSALDKELRRRVWAAASELDLQRCFNRGMIPTQSHLQSDCPAPRNLHDEDFNGDSVTLPDARPLTEFTLASYWAASCDSYTLRSNVCTALNSVKQPLIFDDVRRYTEELDVHVRAIPAWTGKGEVPHALLSLRLRQYLLALHDRHVRQAHTLVERNFSRLVLMETTTAIVKTHKVLANKGIFALQALCDDQMRAALSICHVVAVTDPHCDDMLASAFDQRAPALMQDLISMLYDKAIRSGAEQRVLWIALATNGYMLSSKDPGKGHFYQREAVDVIKKLYQRMMVYQQEQSSAGVSELIGHRGRDPAWVASNKATLVEASGGQTDAALLADPTLLDWDNLAAWTFEDWNFDLAMAFDDLVTPDI